MSKLERDNIVCLMQDGTCQMTHKNELKKFFNSNNVEFALIPLDSKGHQYTACNMVPKKFRSFYIEFDLYLIAPSGVDWIDVEDAICENVRHYRIQCDTFVDFVRFLQSVWLMCTVSEGFDVGVDNPMSAYVFEFSNVAFTYTTKKEIIKDRLKTKNGMISQTFQFMGFIEAIMDVVFGTRKVDSVFLDGNIIIIDSKTNTWEITEFPNSVTDLSVYDRKRFHILPFNDVTLSAADTSYLDLLMINKSMCIIPLQFAAVVDVHSYTGSLLEGPGRTLSEILLDVHGDAYERALSMRSFSDSFVDDILEPYYIAHIRNFVTSSTLLVALHDYRRIMYIIEIITQIVCGTGAIVIMQICSEVRGFEESENTVYHFICGDMDTFDGDDVYESYLSELHMFYMDELPRRYIYRNPESLTEEPYELPF